MAHTTMINMDYGRPFERRAVLEAHPRSVVASRVLRKTVEESAPEYIERSKQKSRKSYLGYRAAVNLFVASCKKTFFDEICRDDMLDFLQELRTRPSDATGAPIGESTVFNDYDSAMLNGIGDEQIIRDAEEERAAREARLRICTIISYILYPIGWIIGLVGKLYDLPRMDAPEL